MARVQKSEIRELEKREHFPTRRRSLEEARTNAERVWSVG
jgi:hypothetical protein